MAQPTNYSECHKIIIDKRTNKSGLSPMDMLIRKEIHFDAVIGYYQETTGLCDENIYLFLFEEINKQIKNGDRCDVLRTCNYRYYLRSPEWRIKRQFVIRFHQRCQLCGNTSTVYHVHHNRYENKPTEKFQDLLVLCEYDHEQHHRNQDELKYYAKSILSWL